MSLEVWNFSVLGNTANYNLWDPNIFDQFRWLSGAIFISQAPVGMKPGQSMFSTSNFGTNLWTSARNINFCTELHWNLNFDIMQQDYVYRSKWLVPKLMCRNSPVPMFGYPHEANSLASPPSWPSRTAAEFVISTSGMSERLKTIVKHPLYMPLQQTLTRRSIPWFNHTCTCIFCKFLKS